MVPFVGARSIFGQTDHIKGPKCMNSADTVARVSVVNDYSYFVLIMATVNRPCQSYYCIIFR